MPQIQCPWCGRCGPRFREEDPGPRPGPHDDGSACVCTHITCGSRRSARRAGGRWWDAASGRWRCEGGCDRKPKVTAPPATAQESPGPRDGW